MSFQGIQLSVDGYVYYNDGAACEKHV